MQQAKDTNLKKEKIADQFWKKDSSEGIFYISFNHSQRNAKKGENPEKMCQLIFLKHTHSNRNNDLKILFIFTGNVKPYIQIHI